MGIVLLAIATTSVALCIWLIVRFVNRRERWVKRTLLATAAMPILYVASFGPVCWITAAPRIAGELGSTKPWMRIFFPIGAAIQSTRSENNRYVKLWITWGAIRNGRVIVPTDSSGMSWFGFTQGE